MLRPCKSSIQCPGTDSPVLNYSSEAPDPEINIGLNFGWGTGIFDPPLDQAFSATSCLGVFESTASQQDADTGAALANALCRDSNVPTDGVNGDFPTQPVIQTFLNGPQSCQGECPDGTTVTIRVAAGLYGARSQILADRIAQSFACRAAQQHLFCITAPKMLTCAGETNAFSIAIKGLGSVYTVTITDGALPPGMSLSQSLDTKTIFISGICDTPANYDFEITVTDNLGNVAVKQLEIGVVGAAPATLPAFSNNIAYSQQLQGVGGTAPYTFLLIAGTLPAGLTLSPSGLISGTPNDSSATVFNVTVSVSDAAGNEDCLQQITIPSGNSCYPQITPGLEATVNVAAGATSVCYDTVADCLITTNTAANAIQVISPTGTLLQTIAVPNASSVFYEDKNKRIYVGYSSGPAGRLRVFDGATFAQLADFTLVGGGVFPVLYFCFDTARNRLWCADDQNTLYVINCATFTYTAINFFSAPPLGASTTGISGIAYCSNQDLVAVAVGYFHPGLHQGLVTINAGTLAYVNIFDVFASFDSEQCIVYCPDNGLVYIPMGGDGLLGVNPSTGTTVLVGFNDLGLEFGVSWNPCTHRIVHFSGGFGGTELIARYINPASNSLVATIHTGLFPNNVAQNSTNSDFDSRRVRLWEAGSAFIARFT